MILELLALVLATLYILHLREVQRYAHMPGSAQFLPLLPFRIPFLNPIPYFELMLDTRLLTPFLLETGKKHNTKVVKITHFLWTKVFVWGPEELKVMTKDHKRFTKGDFFKFPLGVFGENVLAADGDEWKRHRQVVNGAFSTENLEFLSKTTNNSMALLFDRIEKKAEEKVVIPNVQEAISNVTMDIMTKSLFGRDFGVFSESAESKGIAKKLDNFVMSTQLRFILPKFIFESKFLTSLIPGYNRGISEFKEFLTKLQKERDESTSEPRKHLYATLLAANDKFHELDASKSNASEVAGQESAPKMSQTLSDEELMSNALIFFFAGYDTTASATQWLLYSIARHQHVQQKMIAEIDELLGTNQPTHDDFHKLKYCQQVLHENLRHHPPFILGFRFASMDEQTNSVYLTVGEGQKSNKILKGTPLMMMYQATHFDPDVWEKPHEFIPERFEGLSGLKPTQLMSFSAGPRKCVGMNFSYRQQMIMVVRILQRFTVHLPADHKQIEADVSRPTQVPYKLSLELTRRSK